MPYTSTLDLCALCDDVVENLVRFPHESTEASGGREAFGDEIRQLQRFFTLMERVRKAKPPDSIQEEDHWSAVNRLTTRCRSTLCNLRERLANTGTREYELHYNEPWKIGFEDQKPVALATLRAHVNLYIQTLQMSLQTINLSHHKKSKSSQVALEAHTQTLREAFGDLEAVLSRRHSFIDRKSECSVVIDDALCADVQKCLVSAEKLMRSIPTTTSEISEAPTELARQDSVTLPTADPSVANGPTESSRPLEIRRHESPPRVSTDPFMEQAAGSDGASGSDDDPEPDFREEFPPAVYAELIAALQIEILNEVKAGNYDRAERAHHKLMKYLIDRQRHLNIPYDEAQMNESLAGIYVKQKRYDHAKKIISSLLKQQEKDNELKWRLYHMLAEVYLEQNRLPEAEKFSKRAYIGRDRMLGKGHGLIIQSAGLLVRIYELQGDLNKAQAFKNLHDSSSQKNQPPQIAKHVGTRRVNWNPDISVDINAPTKSGETPLVTAVKCGDEEMLQRVLQGGADLEVRGPNGKTPLMHAVWHGHAKIAGVLLSRGAEVDNRSGGWTPLHKAADMGNLDLIELLLRSGADIEAKSPKKLILSKATTEGGSSVRASSDEDDSDDSDSSYGWTPLLRAAISANESVVRILVDHNADVGARSPSKATPLICAAETQNEGIIDFLLLRGASVEAEDEFGWKPLHRLLVKKGGEKVAQTFLNHDADLNSTCFYKKTPLHYAVEKNDEGMASFLLRAGADIEARDVAMRTPLHTAIECRQENMVYILLEFGADAYARDKAGRDALAAANHTLRKSPEIVKLLSKHKRSKNSTNDGTDARRLSSTLSSTSTAVSSKIPASPVISSVKDSSGSWWSRRGSKNKSRR